MDSLEIAWVRGEYGVSREVVRPLGTPAEYRLEASWTDGQSLGGLALALARVRLPQRWTGFQDDGEATSSLLAFYREWGPLGLAHHAFVRQVHVPREKGYVWQWDEAMGDYRLITEALDGEFMEWPAGVGSPQYPGAAAPEEVGKGAEAARQHALAAGWLRGTRPQYRDAPPTAWVLTTEGASFFEGWQPAANFYWHILVTDVLKPGGGSPQRFPSIVSGGAEFWSAYAEPIPSVWDAIWEFQRIWREAVNAASYWGPSHRRHEWFETGLAPHLRKVHPRIAVGQDGALRPVLWAPSLLDAAYFELAASVVCHSLRNCERCQIPFVTTNPKRQTCGKTCGDYVRQWACRHRKRGLAVPAVPIRRWDAAKERAGK